MATTPDDLYISLEDFIIRLLSLAESDGMDALIEMDLSFSHVRTLFCLAHSAEEIPINAIADRLSLSVAAAGRNVEQLVQLNLVERRESPDDRRVKLISLTDAGQKVADQHLESKRASIRTFAEKLPAAQRESLHQSLTDILAGNTLRPSPSDTRTSQSKDSKENCI
ncbi:MAG: MarR family winged helix-turn-helix transcriptional regulator [Aeromicrobium sp.]